MHAFDAPPLHPLEHVRRPLDHGVGDHVGLRVGGPVRRADDPVYELSKEGRVRRTTLRAFAGRHPVTSDGFVPADRLAVAHRRLRETEGRQLGYGLFFGWTCDMYTRWVETGRKRMSPQVKRALQITSGLVGGLLVAGGLARRRRPV